MQNILEMITQVGTLEHHSTNIDLSQFVMVWRVNSEWVKRKVVSGVWRKYDLCVVR
jgi:hypothetical protein